MEQFNEIYSCYYQAVRHILEEGFNQTGFSSDPDNKALPLTQKRMEQIISETCYQDSRLAILPRLINGGWALLDSKEGGFTPRLSKLSKLPLTKLQKSWLKSLLADKRIRLFLSTEDLSSLETALQDIRPLFYTEDFYYYDQYSDGDSYDSSQYQLNFKTILTALNERKTLLVTYSDRQNQSSSFEAAPYQLQYSSKDDKFRLCCLKYSNGRRSLPMILNLSRITFCHVTPSSYPGDITERRFQPIQKSPEPVQIEISGERNSLERCMLHFASYEKRTEYDEQQKVWLCSIFYDLADETELLIDCLSFGPVIRVLGPEAFLRQITKRVERQHQLFYDPCGSEL